MTKPNLKFGSEETLKKKKDLCYMFNQQKLKILISHQACNIIVMHIWINYIHA